MQCKIYFAIISGSDNDRNVHFAEWNGIAKRKWDISWVQLKRFSYSYSVRHHDAIKMAAEWKTARFSHAICNVNIVLAENPIKCFELDSIPGSFKTSTNIFRNWNVWALNAANEIFKCVDKTEINRNFITGLRKEGESESNAISFATTFTHHLHF